MRQGGNLPFKPMLGYHWKKFSGSLCKTVQAVVGCRGMSWDVVGSNGCVEYSKLVKDEDVCVPPHFSSFSPKSLIFPHFHHFSRISGSLCPPDVLLCPGASQCYRGGCQRQAEHGTAGAFHACHVGLYHNLHKPSRIFHYYICMYISPIKNMIMVVNSV